MIGNPGSDLGDAEDCLTVEQPGGYDQLPTAVWIGGAVSPGAVVAYLAIRRFGTMWKGRAFPSRPTLAVHLGIKTRALDDRLNELIRTGWLLITPRRGKDASGKTVQASNHYNLLWEPINSVDDPRLVEHERRVAEFEEWMAHTRATNVATGRPVGAKPRGIRSAGWSEDAGPLVRGRIAKDLQVNRGRGKPHGGTSPASLAPSTVPPAQEIAPSPGAGNRTGGTQKTAPGGAQKTAPYESHGFEPQAFEPQEEQTAGSPLRDDPACVDHHDGTVVVGLFALCADDSHAGTIPGLEPPTFRDFYDAYPKHVAVRDAEKAWRAAVKRAAPEVIVDAARAYAADPNLPSRGWIPNPATWLNGGRWLDGPCEPRSGAAPVARQDIDQAATDRLFEGPMERARAADAAEAAERTARHG